MSCLEATVAVLDGREKKNKRAKHERDIFFTFIHLVFVFAVLVLLILTFFFAIDFASKKKRSKQEKSKQLGALFAIAKSWIEIYSLTATDS